MLKGYLEETDTEPERHISRQKAMPTTDSVSSKTCVNKNNGCRYAFNCLSPSDVTAAARHLSRRVSDVARTPGAPPTPPASGGVCCVRPLTFGSAEITRQHDTPPLLSANADDVPTREQLTLVHTPAPPTAAANPQSESPDYAADNNPHATIDVSSDSSEAEPEADPGNTTTTMAAQTQSPNTPRHATPNHHTPPQPQPSATARSEDTAPTALSPLAYRPTLDRIWPHPKTEMWLNNKAYMDMYCTVRATALPNHMRARIPVPSGLNIPAWRSLLVGYHDRKALDYLEYGWPADFTAPKAPTPTSKNHAEAPEYKVSIVNYVATELTHGALLGPFDEPPFTPWSQISPMMTRPKKNSVNRRVIVDLSWPRGCSVNAGIKRGFYQGRPSKYTLPNVMDAADEVTRIGDGAYLWCADLARAYRQLRCCPLSTPLLGIALDGKFYTDIAPPFGCRTSSMACARTTNAVVYLMRKRGHFVHCYLDDFVGVAADKEQADAAYGELIGLAGELGLALSPAKCHPPAQEVEWLGFKISAQHMQVTIPQQKLQDTLEDCRAWMNKTSTTKRQLQRLAGRLQHIARCVMPARRFMSRIFQAVRDAPKHGAYRALEALRADVRWFLEYADSTNGLVLLKSEQREHWVIECDSSLAAGGAFSAQKYYGTPYPHGMREKYSNIAHLEAINLVIAMRSLAPPTPSDYKIIINTDNAASQQVLSSGSGKDPVLTACARELWLFAACNSCEVQVLHKPGKDLVLADALSRREFDGSANKRAETILRTAGLQEITVTFDNVFTSGL